MKGCIAIIIIGILIIAGIVCAIYFSTFNDAEYEVTVVKTERVTTGHGSNIKSKYLIYCETSDGTPIVFENTDELLRGKFDSSDIYADIKEGERYRFTVVGLRIEFLSSYQNIIKYQKI